MLSPSTAPRWKRQTRIGRWRAVEGGEKRSRPSAALARKSGSSPTLNRAIPPDFTNTRLDIVMAEPPKPSPPFTVFHRPPPPSTALLLLKLRAADRESDGQGPGLNRVLDVGHLPDDHALRVLRHGPAQNRVIDVRDQLLRIRGDGRDGVQCRDRAREPAGREHHRGVHAIEQGPAVHPDVFLF